MNAYEIEVAIQAIREELDAIHVNNDSKVFCVSLGSIEQELKNIEKIIVEAE